MRGARSDDGFSSSPARDTIRIYIYERALRVQDLSSARWSLAISWAYMQFSSRRGQSGCFAYKGAAARGF